MNSRPTGPLDEAVVRDLLRREGDAVAPRADALARFLGAVEGQEARHRPSPRGMRWLAQTLRERLGSRGARVALAVATALLALLLGTIGRPVAAAFVGGVRDAARTVGMRAREIGGVPAATATATPAATTVTPPAPTPTAARTSPTPTTYRDPAGRFSFVAPPGWSVQQSPIAGVAISVASVAPRGGANVATEATAGTQTLDEYTAATLAAIQREHPGYRVTVAGVQPATLGAYPARRYEIVDGSGQGLRFIQYVALVGTQGYVLTLTYTDSDAAAFLQQAQGLIDTFAFGAST